MTDEKVECGIDGVTQRLIARIAIREIPDDYEPGDDPENLLLASIRHEFTNYDELVYELDMHCQERVDKELPCVVRDSDGELLCDLFECAQQTLRWACKDQARSGYEAWMRKRAKGDSGTTGSDGESDQHTRIGGSEMVTYMVLKGYRLEDSDCECLKGKTRKVLIAGECLGSHGESEWSAGLPGSGFDHDLGTQQTLYRTENGRLIVAETKVSAIPPAPGEEEGRREIEYTLEEIHEEDLLAGGQFEELGREVHGGAKPLSLDEGLNWRT